MTISHHARLLLFAITIASCNQHSKDHHQPVRDAVGDQSSNQYLGMAEGAAVFPMNIQKGGKFKSIDQIRIQAMGIIEHRVQEYPKALAMLTHAYWHPEFVFNAGSMSKEGDYDGYWIKFGEDFRYQYGVHSVVHGGGRYHFRLEDKSLYMVDDDIEYEPKVWTVNYNGSVMAIVGTHQYNVNNGMQIKLVEIERNPLI